MNILEILKKRKSERLFSEMNLNEQLVEHFYDILSMSNTAGNIRSVRLKIVDEENEKRTCFFASNLQPVIENAPFLLVIGNDDKLLNETYPKEWVDIYGIQNSSILAQNLVLFLTELGCASCWVGGFNRDFLMKKLELDFTPWIIIAFGEKNGG